MLIIKKSNQWKTKKINKWKTKKIKAKHIYMYMDKSRDYSINKKIIKGLKLKIQSIRAEMNIKYKGIKIQN